jgi:hypothetical protein
MLEVPSAEECVQRFAQVAADPLSREYLHFHARRFSYLLEIATEAAKEFGPACRILDVGPSFQTELIRQSVPQAVVNTLGYLDGRFPLRPGEQHFPLDLNETQFPERCPAPPLQHDIMVMAEVIEHLYTAPHLVLRYLARWLTPRGVLILQTPNAVALSRRIALLQGRNPYEMIRDQRENPGHFREYTVSELREVGSQAGLRMERFECRCYFGRPSLKGRIYETLCALGPGRLKDGITAWFRKDLA